MKLTHLAPAAVLGLSGCSLFPMALPQSVTADPPVTPAAVELPAREAARVSLRTAHEFERAGQPAEAARLFEQARQNDPGLTKVAGRRLAVVYDQLGEFGKADAEYDKLLVATPKDADLLNDAGYSRYCRGEWAAAEGLFRRATAVDPSHKRAAVNLGLALAQQGKSAEALKAFEGAVRPADAHSNLGFVLAARGDKAAAAAEYCLAVDLDPGHKQARAALAALGK